MRAFHDIETRSRRGIKHGTWAYGEDAVVLLWAFAIDDGPVSVWDRTAGGDMPSELAAALADPDLYAKDSKKAVALGQRLPLAKEALEKVFNRWASLSEAVQ